MLNVIKTSNQQWIECGNQKGLQIMAITKNFNGDEIIKLISFYSVYPQWKLIEKIIELEDEVQLKSILKQYYFENQ